MCRTHYREIQFQIHLLGISISMENRKTDTIKRVITSKYSTPE